jgi:hypothetical protein
MANKSLFIINPELFEEMMGYYDDYKKRVGVVPPTSQGINLN